MAVRPGVLQIFGLTRTDEHASKSSLFEWISLVPQIGERRNSNTWFGSFLFRLRLSWLENTYSCKRPRVFQKKKNYNILKAEVVSFKVATLEVARIVHGVRLT